MNCFLCGRNGKSDPLDRHHGFTGALRKKADKYGLYVYLCHDRCHIFGAEAAHRCRATQLKIQQHLQRKAMQENSWIIEDFIREFHKNYL